MLAIIAAAIFALALLFDLAEMSSDALDFYTLITLGLLLLALHMAGYGTRWRWRGRRRPRARRR